MTSPDAAAPLLARRLPIQEVRYPVAKRGKAAAMAGRSVSEAIDPIRTSILVVLLPSHSMGTSYCSEADAP